jgi:hypothetical protein
VLGCFNLIPAGPLDGGRVLHSIIWSKSKNFLKATRVCYILGRGFALILILLGIMFLFIGIIAPFWIIMGVILWNISKREYMQVLLVEKLRQRKIGELDLSTANVSNSDLDKSKAVYASVDEDCYSVLCRLLGASKEIVIISGISPGVTGFVPLNTMVQLIINEANCN